MTTPPSAPALSVLAPEFLTAIRTCLPDDALATDAESLATYGRDWTKVFNPKPCMVVFPRTTREVSDVLRLCSQFGVAVVPSGGRTGLAGGAVAESNELVLSLERMRGIGPVDTAGLTVTVEAGVVTQALHEHLKPLGLTWPVDFASKGSSHVGGNIATNAGGVKVIRYGLTRHWVLGLRVVLGDGRILTLNGALEKNNTGPDLRQLFIGSEGTLGVVTEATLKLCALPRPADVFLFSVRDLRCVLDLFRHVRRSPMTLSAYEFFTDKCLARLQRHRNVRSPFADPASHFVLLEVDAGEHDHWLEDVFARGLVLDGVRAESSAQASELWALREGISESLSATGLPHKNDISLPVAALEAFVDDMERLLAERYPSFELCVFGHIGDGNLHVNIMKPETMDKAAFLAMAHDSDRAMFELVRSHRGSISAEHGIGLLKRDHLHFSRTPEEIALFRMLKAGFDPKGILNPGKIWPSPSAEL